MREVLSNENSEQALRPTSKVLAYEPTQADTLVLKQQPLNASQERRRREALDQQTRQAVTPARRKSENGDYTRAIHQGPRSHQLWLP